MVQGRPGIASHMASIRCEPILYASAQQVLGKEFEMKKGGDDHVAVSCDTSADQYILYYWPGFQGLFHPHPYRSCLALLSLSSRQRFLSHYYNHTLTISCTCCYVEIYSHDDSPILSHRCCATLLALLSLLLVFAVSVCYLIVIQVCSVGSNIQWSVV